MGRLTAEQKVAFDKVIKQAPIHQLLVWVWWDLFNSCKSKVLINSVTNGMSWRFAYIRAKLYKGK